MRVVHAYSCIAMCAIDSRGTDRDGCIPLKRGRDCDPINVAGMVGSNGMQL